MEKVEASLVELIKRMIRGIPLFIICGILGASINYLYHKKTAVTYYTAQTTLFAICNAENSALQAGINNITLSSQLMPTFFQIIRTDDFLVKVIEEAKVDYTTSEVRQMLLTSSVENTPIFRLYVTCTREEDALAIRDAIIKQGPQQIYNVVKLGYFKEIDRSPAPLKPERQSLQKPFLIGGIVGACIPMLIVMMIILLDTTVRNEEQLEYYHQLKILASIPSIKYK